MMSINDKIKKLEHQIMDELSGAREYKQCAMNWKDTDPEISKKYMDMSKQELGHGKDLMEIMSVVTKTKPEMSSIYEFLKEVNEEQIEEIEK